MAEQDIEVFLDESTLGTAGVSKLRAIAARAKLLEPLLAGSLTSSQALVLARLIANTTEFELRSITQLLVAGSLGLDTWHRIMASEVSSGHAASALAASSMAEPDAPLLDSLRPKVQEQFGYLNRFRGRLLSGELLLGQEAVAYAGLYGAATWAVGQNVHRDLRFQKGATVYVNVLGATEHCVKCIDEEAKGWVPIGELSPIGSRDCKVRCACYFLYA